MATTRTARLAAAVALAAGMLLAATPGARATEQHVVTFTARIEPGRCSAGPPHDPSPYASAYSENSLPAEATWDGEEYWTGGGSFSLSYTYPECSAGEPDPEEIHGVVRRGQVYSSEMADAEYRVRRALGEWPPAGRSINAELTYGQGDIAIRDGRWNATMPATLEYTNSRDDGTYERYEVPGRVDIQSVHTLGLVEVTITRLG